MTKETRDYFQTYYFKKKSHSSLAITCLTTSRLTSTLYNECTNGRQLIWVEEDNDYVADWYLKTEDKEDTDLLRNKQLDGI